TMVDVTMPWLVWSSPALVETIREHAAEADVVVCAHPWMFECVRDLVRGGRRLLVYDAHNCEAALRESLLADTPFGRCLAENAARVERDLCAAADVVFACSDDDRAELAMRYGVAEKTIVVPNGVDAARIRPASLAERAAAKRALGVDGFVAV